jgi:AraC-like DNA-binding protein
MKARTLQRRLAAAGASFTALLDDVRRTLVQRYLLDDSMSLTEVAFLLGFKEQSAFNHTFRGWFGMSPSAWRRKNLESATADLAKKH